LGQLPARNSRYMTWKKRIDQADPDPYVGILNSLVRDFVAPYGEVNPDLFGVDHHGRSQDHLGKIYLWQK
jgi:hypothetical protein